MHGDPVQAADPTGLFFSLGGFLASFSVGSFNRGREGAASGGVFISGASLARWIRVTQQIYRLVENAYEVYQIAQAILDFLEFDRDDLEEMRNEVMRLGAFLTGGGATPPSAPTSGSSAFAAAAQSSLGGGGSAAGGVTAAFETQLGIPLKKGSSAESVGRIG